MGARIATHLANAGIPCYLLDIVPPSLTPAEQALVIRINQFVKSSGDAEKNGDLRSADDLASRAHILAKELQSGK